MSGSGEQLTISRDPIRKSKKKKNKIRAPEAVREAVREPALEPGTRRVEVPPAGSGIQAQLTETTFAQYLDGFQEVQPVDLLQLKGGRVRYAIDTLDSYGGRAYTQYRLGGWLSKVDPQLRFLRLFNPIAKRAWSVQLQKPGQRVRLYYMAPATSDETAMLRSLLTKLQNGEIQITKMP